MSNEDEHIFVRRAEAFIGKLLRTTPNWAPYFTKENCENLAKIIVNLKAHYLGNLDTATKTIYPGTFSLLQFLSDVEPDGLDVVFVADPEVESLFVNAFGVRGVKQFTQRQKDIIEIIGGKDITVTSNALTRLSPDFGHWAKQGILMLPTTFTHHGAAPKSHKKMWKKVIKSFIREIDSRHPTISWVFVGDDKEDYKDSLSITGRDLTIPEFTEENLPSLHMLEPFERINRLHKHARKIEWL